MSFLDLVIGLAPLGLLFGLTVLVVWRGMSRKPDGSKNKRNVGGGPRDPL